MEPLVIRRSLRFSRYSTPRRRRLTDLRTAAFRRRRVASRVTTEITEEKRSRLPRSSRHTGDRRRRRRRRSRRRSTPVFNSALISLSFFPYLFLRFPLSLVAGTGRAPDAGPVLAAASSVCRDDAMDAVAISSAEKMRRAFATRTAAVMSNDTRRSATTCLPRRRRAAAAAR